MGQLYLGSRVITPIITTGASNLESLTVTPSTTQQVITPSGSVDGYSDVTVSAVTASIDSNISSGNIKKDVVILGVTGSYEGEAPNLQSKTLTVGQSTATTTTVEPDSNYDGLSSVTVDLSEIEALLTEINGE
jgi:hypothetical protein